MNMKNEMRTSTFIYNDESYDFNFKTNLSADEKLTFVRTVVNSIVSDSGYDVVIKDLIFDFAIIDVFTNIETSFINAKDEDGNDINPIILIEHFLEETNVVEIVKENMVDGLLDELDNAVNLNVQYLTGIHTSPINDAISKLVSVLEKKIDKIDLDSMMNMATKFVGMTEDFTVDNIVKSYIDSDTHKNNLDEIAKSKE